MTSPHGDKSEITEIPGDCRAYIDEEELHGVTSRSPTAESSVVTEAFSGSPPVGYQANFIRWCAAYSFGEMAV